MMRFRTTTALSLILCCVTLNANAQPTGRLTGRVLDHTGASLPGVAIDLMANAREMTVTFRNVADVENPAANLVGIAASASQGAVTAAQLDAHPVMRAGEVLETVPGLIVSQHSGEGKANQCYLRGFNRLEIVSCRSLIEDRRRASTIPVTMTTRRTGTRLP